MNRTVATGTGFIGQYRPEVAKVYESLASCPDELILWMHHVPYTHVLHSGKTVIQHIYDTHYKGAEDAEQFVARWRYLEGKVDEQRYLEVLERLEYQAGHAQVWRDSICNWFLKTSGIPDAEGRAGTFPNRVEGEAMQLDGYREIDVTPWETASGSKAIECTLGRDECSASFQYDGEAGWRDLDVQYFDQRNGISTYKVFLDGQLVSEWQADDSIPTDKPDGHSSTRRRIGALALMPGDEIRITGAGNGGERAALDYIEIHPIPE
jgi:alpha-glucuronidase